MAGQGMGVEHSNNILFVLTLLSLWTSFVPILGSFPVVPCALTVRGLGPYPLEKPKVAPATHTASVGGQSLVSSQRVTLG